MADTSFQVDIPDRALFKASEVCDLAKVQPYVLRSWEAEFKDLGVVRGGSSARVYRREDVERVLRIKHLLLIEGLTLAGVRRRLEEEAEPPLDEQSIAVPATMLSADARERIGSVKQGLRSLLDMLDAAAAVPKSEGTSERGADDASGFALTSAERRESAPKPARGAAAKDEAGKSASSRRKRPA
jgi:DNA-binding transcriptional MerR regulator